MILPKEIKGPHKIRDAAILDLYWSGMTSEEIEALGIYRIGARRIRKIVYDNKEYLLSLKNYERAQQVHRIKRQIRKRPDSNKDVIDIEKTLNDVLNADQPLVDQSEHTTIQFINYGEINTKKENEFADTDRKLSTP